MPIALDRAAAAALRLLPPEAAHSLAIGVLERAPLPPRGRRTPEALRTRLFGCVFENPIGLAAGFDKDARTWRAFGQLGWGFVEVGGVTPLPQPGNPRPRLFRLPGQAVVNRMGFNSCGATRVRERLQPREPRAPLLVNLGMNRDTADPADDWEAVLQVLFGLADGFTINISSPNTAGLRQLAEGRRLREQIGRVAAARNGLSRDAGRERPALLVKLSPDMAEADLRRTASICVEAGADGIIATNTSAELRRQLASPSVSEGGGLSGAPLRALAERALRQIRDETRGAVPLIGVGGIFTAEDAYARIRAGASLVQIYTAMIWEGVGIGPRIAGGLASLLARDGFRSVDEAVGTDAIR